MLNVLIIRVIDYSVTLDYILYNSIAMKHPTI